MTAPVLYLSPHLDDAVLSCSGRILRQAAAGRVVVATVFSEGGPLHERRRAEDQVAVRQLGAEPRWIGLLDAPFRRDFYRSYREIVLETHPDDVDFSSVVFRRLAALCEELRPSLIVAPLGVGGHIDHRLVHDAARRLPRVTFYEDRPYCFVKHAVRLRLSELERAPAGDEPPLDLAAAPVDIVRQEFLDDLPKWHWIDTYLPPGPERERCGQQQAARFGRRPPASDSQPALACRVETGDESQIAAAAQAAAAYTTQFPDLFPNRAACIAAARQYARRIGAPGPLAERYWTPSQP